MKSIISFIKNKNYGLYFNISFFLFGMLFLFCLFSFSQFQKNIFLIIPFFILSIPLLFIYPQALLFLLFASFYWEYHIVDRKFFFVSWSQVLFVFAMAGFLSKYLFSKMHPKMTLSRPLLTYLLLFLSAALISFFINLYQHDIGEIAVSVSYLCNFALIVLAFILFSSNDMKEWKNSIILFVFILSFLEIPVVALQVMKLGGNYMASYRDITGTFGAHHSQLANMMTFPLGFALSKILDKPKTKYLILLIILAFASLYSIVYSGSRSNILGIVGAIVVLLLLKIRFKRIYFLYISVFVVGLILLIELSPIKHLIDVTIHSNDTGSLDLSSLYRFIIWNDCWNYYLNSSIMRKLFGVGMANLMTISFPEFIIDSKYLGGAHNIFLHVLLETGIVGFAIFMMFYITVLIKLFKQSRSDNLALAYFFITLSLLLSGLTQEIFWFQPSFGCLWLYHTCILSLILDNGPTLRRSHISQSQ
jgi:O-antigen ligase